MRRSWFLHWANNFTTASIVGFITMVITWGAMGLLSETRFNVGPITFWRVFGLGSAVSFFWLWPFLEIISDRAGEKLNTEINGLVKQRNELLIKTDLQKTFIGCFVSFSHVKEVIEDLHREYWEALDATCEVARDGNPGQTSPQGLRDFDDALQKARRVAHEKESALRKAYELAQRMQQSGALKPFSEYFSNPPMNASVTVHAPEDVVDEWTLSSPESEV